MEERFGLTPKSNDDAKLVKKVLPSDYRRDERFIVFTGRTWTDPKWERAEDERKVCLALEKVAAEVGTDSVTAG